MARDIFERHAVVRLLVYAAAVVAVLYAVSMTWGIVTHYDTIILMLFLAWIFAFALQPLLGVLLRIGMPRLLAVTLIYVALLAAAVGVILLSVLTIHGQVANLGSMFGGLFSTGNLSALEGGIVRLLQGFGVSPRDAHDFIAQAGRQLQTVGSNLASQALAGAEAVFSGAVTLIFNATVVVVLSFYMMLDGAALVERMIGRLPSTWVPTVRLFQGHVDTIFGGFLRAALVISGTYAVLNWVVLAVLGHPTAVLFALLAGILLVVPWIGGILAIIPPAVLVLIDSPSSVAVRNLVILVIALVIAQQVIMQIVAPRVISAHVGLHPLLVFAALLIGGREAGVWGVLFGPPFAAVIVAMVDTIIERWQRTRGTQPNIEASGPSGGEEAEEAVVDGGSQTTEGKQLVELPG